jgi:hypothetical protein
MSLGEKKKFAQKLKNKKYFPSFSPPSLSSCHLQKSNKRKTPFFADVLANFHFDHFSLSPPSSCHLQIVVKYIKQSGIVLKRHQKWSVGAS